MGMNMIITLIMGITMSTILGTAIAPSIIESTKVTKVQTETINNQEVIFEAIKRYITIEQEAPEDMDDLFSADYIDEKVNDNGFGGEYEIKVDKTKGVVTIITTIDDPKAQEIFLKSFKGTSKPSYKVNEDGTWDTNKFETKYVIPNNIMHGNALLMTGIPIGSTEPDHNTNKYWYDTSTGEAILKVYNNSSSWTEVNLGTSNSPEEKFITGDLAIFDYSYKLDPSLGEKTLLEIIPSKPGSLKFSYYNYFGPIFIYINDKKIDFAINDFVDENDYYPAFVLFFNANDKIEVKKTNRLDSFKIYFAPESVGNLKITKFNYDDADIKTTEVNLGTSNSSEKKFIAGDLAIFDYSYNIDLSLGEKTFLEIIPSKPGSLKFSYYYFKPISIYINDKKIDLIISDNVKWASTNNMFVLFFNANDKIEVKTTNRLFSFRIYITPESAGPSDLNITKFTY